MGRNHGSLCGVDKEMGKFVSSRNYTPYFKLRAEIIKFFDGVNNILMTESEKQVSEATVIVMIWKVIEAQRSRGEDMTVECLLNEEKLLHLSMICLEKKSIKAVPFNLPQEISSFVLKINKVTMQNFKEQSENMDIKLMTKAIDLIMTPHISKYLEDSLELGRIKVLTFNNLACIYKKKKKFGLAIRAVTYAIQIEEYLFKNKERGQKYEIIQTYLNKAAILSQMKKHEKAIDEIAKARKIVDMIEKEVENQEASSSEEEQKRLTEKKYYGMYMKMVINYNMGVEKQHLKLGESATEYYRLGRKLAVAISNPYMIKKFDGILSKIGSVR